MISEYSRLARPYFVLLLIVTVGRWLMGTAFAVPYEQGTHVLSIVTLTVFASIFGAAYTRRWLGYRLVQAAGFAVFMAVASQVVILLSTAVSYGLGVESYFNNPLAITRRVEPIGFAQAMGVRVFGLIVNTLINAIAGALGWGLGALLPARER